MAKKPSLHRIIPLGASCLIHVALIGAVVALGRDLTIPQLAAVVIADLTLIEVPRLDEVPPSVAAKPERPKAERLTLPKPIATPVPARIETPTTVRAPEPETAAAPIPAPPLVDLEAPRSAPEPAGVAGPSSFEVGEDSTSTLTPAESSRSTSDAGVPTWPPRSATAIPPDGVTRTAIPRGGYQVRPAYPVSARRLGIQGLTTLRVYVSADGRVTEVTVQESAGHPDLDNAAAEAVKRWRFEPARRGAEAVGMWVLLPVEFRLR